MNMLSTPVSASQTRRPVLAVLLSVAATGLGHVYCGRLLKGLILFFAGFAFAPIVVFAAQNAASPLMLSVVILSLLLLLGVFLYALVDAGLLARKIGSDYRPKEYNRWYVYLLFIVVALTYPTNLASSIRDNVLQAFKIPTTSMAPAILPGDRVLLNKTRYRLHRPQRGDVVIFVYPDDRRLFYMKRIVGLPGERVAIRDGVVHINGRPLPQKEMDTESQMNLDLPPGAKIVMEESDNGSYPIIVGPEPLDDMAEVVVPHGRCFVLADNRQWKGNHGENFGDSRYLGPIPLSDIKGRLDYIYWPAQSLKRFGVFHNQ